MGWRWWQWAVVISGVATALLISGDARAASVFEQNTNDTNEGYAVTSGMGGYFHHDAGTYASSNPTGQFSTSTDAVTSVAWLVKNDGASTCTGSFNASSGWMLACPSDATCAYNADQLVVYSLCDSLNVPPGGEQWVRCTLAASRQANRVYGFSAVSLPSSSNCGSTYTRYSSTDVVSGVERDSGGDYAFRICTEGTDCSVSSVSDYHAAIEKPVTGNYTAPAPLRIGTDVLASDVDGEGQGVAFQVLLEAYSGSWSEYDTLEYTDADAPLTYTCSTLFAGTFSGPCVKLGSVLDTFTLPDLPDGNYRVSARVAIIEDDVPGPYGEWSATRSFTVGEASPISTDITEVFTAGSSSEECGAANPWDVETTGWEGFIDGIKRALWGFFWVDCVTTQPLVDLRDELAQHAPFRQAFQTLGYLVDALNNAQAPEDSNLSIPAPAPWEGSDIVIFSPQAVYDFMGGEDGWGTLVRPLIAAGTALALGLYFVRDWANFFNETA